MHHHREFLFADGRCTHAESATAEDPASVQGSLPGPAKVVTDADIARLQNEAEASWKKKTPAGTEEEEKKKEDEEEHMDADHAPVADKDKDTNGGPDVGGGLGMPT